MEIISRVRCEGSQHCSAATLTAALSETDGDGYVVTRTNSQPALMSTYRSWSMLFSTVGWAEPKKGMKRSISVNKGMMYLQTTLKITKTKASSERGSRASAHDMKEKDVVDEVRPCASTTMRKECRTVMSNLIKGRAPVCYF